MCEYYGDLSSKEDEKSCIEDQWTFESGSERSFYLYLTVGGAEKRAFHDDVRRRACLNCPD